MIANVGRAAAALSLLLLGCAGSASADPPNLDELTTLNGIGGFGAVGKIAASRAVVAPGNRMGFSLRVTYENDGDPHYWAIRVPLPTGARPETFDGFSCDLRVENADAGANLAIFLTETDDDRWVCLDTRLASQPKGKWVHVEVRRAAMRPWLTGNGKPEWERLSGLGVEPSGGKSVFYLDNARLLGPGGRSTDMITAADDGYVADPSWHERVRISPPGVVYLPGLSRQNLLEDRTAAKFRGILGAVGTSAFGAPAVSALRADGVEAIDYGSIGGSYVRYLTRRQAWDVNSDGGSPNRTPFFETWYTGYHCLAHAHPAVTEAGARRIDALAKSGLGAWMVVDYTMPWSGGSFGYAPVMIEAYRKGLSGAGDPLVVVEKGRRRALEFREYFRSYNGFFPEPSELGYRSWSEFTPDKPGATGLYSKARATMFLYLRAFEWLKLVDRLGRHYQARGGHGLWIIPNPEDSYGSPDYVHLVRSAGARNLFPEWFGGAPTLTEGAYPSLGYLREEADRSGGRLSVLFETGAGGHAAPYWDWRVAYAASYVLTAASAADDFDNDFVDEATYGVMSDPRNAGQYARYRDAAAKALAFRQARAERPKRPRSRILCVADRPPARATGSIFYNVDHRYGLSLALSRAHLPFDVRDSLDIERVLDRYDVVAYNPCSPRVGDPERLRRWLVAKPGRVLITHTFIPTRSAREYPGLDRNAELGTARSGNLWGLGTIRMASPRAATVTASSGPWAGVFRKGEHLQLPPVLTGCSGGAPAVTTDAGRLVSVARVGKSTVVYLHFAAPDPAAPAVRDLAIRAVRVAAGLAGIRPVCQADADTIVQVFGVKGGTSLAVWDAPTATKWAFRYEPGIPPMEYAAPGVSREVTLAARGASKWVVYDLLEDRVAEVRPERGRVAIHLIGAIGGLFYVGPDTAAFRKTVDSARRARRVPALDKPARR